MAGHIPRFLYAPDGVGAGAAPAEAISPAPVAPSIAAAEAQAAPVSPPDNGAASPSIEPVKAPAPAPETTPEKKIGTESPEPVKNEFKPSLLEEGAKPATEPAKPDAAKPEAKEAAPVEAVAVPEPPLKYEFQMPDGFDPKGIEPERMSAYTEILGGARVPPEVGQKLLDMHIAGVKETTARLAQSQWDVFNRQQDAWRDEVKGDPEIGGSRLQTALRTCAAVIEQYGGSAEQQAKIKNVMASSGAGNNVEVIRMIHRIGLSLAKEAAPVPAPAPRAAQMTREQKGLARYGGTTG